MSMGFPTKDEMDRKWIKRLNEDQRAVIVDLLRTTTLSINDIASSIRAPLQAVDAFVRKYGRRVNESQS